MSEPNELPIPRREHNDQTSGDGAGAQGAGNSRPRFHSKSAVEIQAAIDLVLAMVAGGAMPEGRAKTLIQGLRAQLECIRLYQADERAGAVAGADLDAAAEFFASHPEMLRTLSPTIDDAALRDLFRRFGGSFGNS